MEIMSIRLFHKPFFGFSLERSVRGENYESSVYMDKGQGTRRPSRKFIYANRNQLVYDKIWSSKFSGKDEKFLRWKIGSRSMSKVYCVKEPFSRSKVIVKSINPLWKKSILFIRCSVLLSVISGVCLLLWYGRAKAKDFVEAKLLPSVCSVLSEYIQRELDFGKIKRITPLSITLESCSVGPRNDEFSCGEFPVVKLSIHPFSSLRSGKIVIDAVLSHPVLLISQKKDYTWLGIPSSEGSLHSRTSSEEGIDYRTKIRRISREESAALWSIERDKSAKEMAEIGYVALDRNSSHSEVNFHDSEGLLRSESFSCMDSSINWRDHHSVNTGIGYDTRHANLEKAFGEKIPGSGFKFLSRIISSPKRHNAKKKANKGAPSDVSFISKRRILDRSALAALPYFQGLASGKSGAAENYDVANIKSLVNNENIEREKNVEFGNYETAGGYVGLKASSELEDRKRGLVAGDNMGIIPVSVNKKSSDDRTNSSSVIHDPLVMAIGRLNGVEKVSERLSSFDSISDEALKAGCNSNNVVLGVDVINSQLSTSESLKDHTAQNTNFVKRLLFPISPSKLRLGFPDLHTRAREALLAFISGPIQRLIVGMGSKVEAIVAEFFEGVNEAKSEGIEKMLLVTLDSVRFKGGTLMLLAYSDREPREMDNVNGQIRFQNHYGRVNLQLSGICNMWRSDVTTENGGLLSANVFVDIVEQKWHANLKVANVFVPLFERILEIPITWFKGRASGEVHICMSRGESFPNLHGQLDVTGLAFQVVDAPSRFSDMSSSLCFRGQRIFLHNASGWFGSVPLEASGDFGINPEDGEFHLMCQVPSVEVNALMKTFKMKPLMFPLAGSVTAVFNCQGPLDAPIFVGSGMVSRKIGHAVYDFPISSAYEAMMKNKEAGAMAAFDRVPLSYLSANFTFNTDNCVADLYGIRASLVDGGEIRGAGNAWICQEGEVDDTAIDMNFSGNLSFDKILHRYLPGYLPLMMLKLGDLNGETKLSGSLLKPRFDIKWVAPKAEGSFGDARGDIILSHDYITFTSSSVAFELYTKFQTRYCDEYLINQNEHDVKTSPRLFIVEGVEMDIRMRGFEFFSFISPYTFDSLRPMHLKATGRVRFQGKMVKPRYGVDKEVPGVGTTVKDNNHNLAGEVTISGLKLNQLILAPQLAGSLSISPECVKLDAKGRPDESLAMEIIGPKEPNSEDNIQNGVSLSFSLQKGQLRANIYYQPQHSANLEVRQLPLDELELASLRGSLQRAEVQLNFQKRRGHGMLSLLHPKFSGVLGEALDVAARWSGDVITVEKTVLEQTNSRYELQGEYVLPGSRERVPSGKGKGGFLKRAMTGHLGSMISSMGRWRMRLEVPKAEVAEMLPLAGLLSRSTDPAVRSRSKDFFVQSLQSVGIYGESIEDLLEEIHGIYNSQTEVILEDFSLPGLAELKGHWHGSLDASGGGNGDTMADFDFQGEDWEWGAYTTQRVLAVGAYSNNDGLRLERLLIQRDNATIHADGTVFGPKTNLHFAVLNFPVSLVPTLVQVIESSATDAIQSLRQLLTPIKGILHMEGDLRGNLAKPECDVQVRLLDGAIGGIDLGRAEIVASLTSSSRFLFNAKFEPVIQTGHVHIQGSVPVNFVQNTSDEKNMEEDKSGATWVSGWAKERGKESLDEAGEKKVNRERSEEGWDIELAESLKGLNWKMLDAGEVRVDTDIKDGGMMLLAALCPYADWLHGSADIMLQVRGTVEQPVLDGSASFHRASISSPALREPLTNFGGTVTVKSNRLCIRSLESRVSRRGKLLVKGNLPLRTSEASDGDRIALKCEVLQVRAKNILSGQVDTQMQITGSILQPDISGKIHLSHGEAYLPHDKSNGASPFDRVGSNQSGLPSGSYNRTVASRYVSRFFSSEPAASKITFSDSSGKEAEVEKEMEQVSTKPNIDVRLNDLKLVLGPELRIVYPLILNFAVSGELELNGVVHPKWIKPRGVLTFENGDVNLVATQVRLKREHLNVAKFEPDNGLDPMLDLALVGSEWQFRIQSRASNWQDKLVVTSTRSVEQDVLTSTEAARVFESQLAESILEGDGQLAFKKLATATLETLMPRIEGKGEFGQARWRLVYAPQIPSLLSVDPTIDPLKSLANNISFGTEVEVQLGKRLQASVVRQMKDSEMAMQWTLIYQLTSRLRVLLQSAPSKRLLFEYSATSQD